MDIQTQGRKYTYKKATMGWKGLMRRVRGLREGMFILYLLAEVYLLDPTLMNSLLVPPTPFSSPLPSHTYIHTRQNPQTGRHRIPSPSNSHHPSHRPASAPLTTVSSRTYPSLVHSPNSINPAQRIVYNFPFCASSPGLLTEVGGGRGMGRCLGLMVIRR